MVTVGAVKSGKTFDWKHKCDEHATYQQQERRGQHNESILK
jgi:hypothetical protein